MQGSSMSVAGEAARGSFGLGQTSFYNTISFIVSKIHLSNSRVLAINESIKSIDSIDSSIIGNVVSLKIQKRISPVVGAENGFSGSSVIKFENKLVSGSIKSTAFYYNTNTANTNINSVYIQDNLTTASTSSLDLIDFYSGTKLVSGIGTANYNTGEISIPSLIPAGYIENSPDIRISAKIEEMDIQSTNNLILIIDDTKLDTFSKRTSGLTVTVISE
jgi:hypothetical protein